VNDALWVEGGTLFDGRGGPGAPATLRVVDGRVAELWFHNWDDRAVDEFWS
jgi:hypothetical protein